MRSRRVPSTADAARVFELGFAAQHAVWPLSTRRASSAARQLAGSYRYGLRLASGVLP